MTQGKGREQWDNPYHGTACPGFSQSLTSGPLQRTILKKVLLGEKRPAVFPTFELGHVGACWITCDQGLTVFAGEDLS